MMNKKVICVLYTVLVMVSSIGCVKQKDNKEGNLPNTDNTRIAATSTSVMEICRRMELDLVGVPKSENVEIPRCYKDATIVGTPMSPDMEILSNLRPDWVLSPVTLKSDLQPKYEAEKLNYAFLNLKSTQGMFQSIKEMGELFGKEKEANKMVEEYETYMKSYQAKHQDLEGPKVLLLMGLPGGSYVVATKNSYAGSLLELSGAKNIYDSETEEFLNINTEDMLEKNPDIILRTAHAYPDEVMAAFAKEFEGNDIWKHFDAVQNGRVYDLPYQYFGMSATFDYQKALEHLDGVLYEK